ncbi:MAG: hypothetical protein ACRC9H_09100 [Aeromonas veronii]
MAIANGKKTTSKDTSKEREVLGYWNPRGIITASGDVRKMSTQFGISLYADDPVHVALFAAWEKKEDPSFLVKLAGTIVSAKKQEAEEIPFDL